MIVARDRIQWRNLVNMSLISCVHKGEESHGLSFFVDFVRWLRYLETLDLQCET